MNLRNEVEKIKKEGIAKRTRKQSYVRILLFMQFQKVVLIEMLQLKVAL